MAEKKAPSLAAEVRQVEKTVHETGVGQSDRVETHYELGVNVGGTFVRVSSVTADQVEAAKTAAAAAGEQDTAGNGGGSSSSTN